MKIKKGSLSLDKKERKTVLVNIRLTETQNLRFKEKLKKDNFKRQYLLEKLIESYLAGLFD